MVDGVRHKIGEEFIMKDCSGVCQCLKYASGHDGFSCLPLCGTYYLRCRPGQKRVYYKRPLPGTKCSCPHQKCVPEGNLVFFLLLAVKSEFP